MWLPLPFTLRRWHCRLSSDNSRLICSTSDVLMNRRNNPPPPGAVVAFIMILVPYTKLPTYLLYLHCGLILWWFRHAHTERVTCLQTETSNVWTFLWPKLVCGASWSFVLSISARGIKHSGRTSMCWTVCESLYLSTSQFFSPFVSREWMEIF